MTYLDLVLNLSLLVALSIVSGFIDDRWPRHSRAGVLVQGALFGGAAVLGMLRPVNLGPGLIFDGRSVMVSLGALFFGPWAAAVAGAMAVSCRVAIGGAGTLTGALVVLSSAGIGLLARPRLKILENSPSARQLFLFGLAVHAAMLGLMFTLPGGAGLPTFLRIGPPVILLYPLATLLAGKILADQVEAKRVVKELQESRERLVSAQRIAGLGDFIWDAETGQVSWSDALYELLGYDRADKIDYEKVDRQIHHPDDLDSITRWLEGAIASGKEVLEPNEYRVLCKDGRVLFVRTVGVIERREGKAPRIFATIQDITERKGAEEALREAMLRQNEAVRAGNVGLWDRDLVTGRVRYSAEWKRQIGYEEHEIGDDFAEWRSRVHPDDLPATLRRLEETVAGDRQEYQAEFRFRHRSGSYRWILSQGSVIRDRDGRPVRLLGSHVDITAAKQAEAEQEKLRAQLSNALEIAHLGPWEYDALEDLFIFNDHFYKIFGTTAEKVGGYTMAPAEYARRFVHPEDVPVVEKEIRKALQTADPDFSQVLEHRILYADGKVGHVSVRYFVSKDAQGRTVKTYGVNQDITERKKLEEQIQNAQKMESIGSLAGGIAHDFNNILFPIVGMAELLLDDLEPGSPQYENAQEILTAGKRGSDLVKQILAFSRQSEHRLIPVRVQQVLKEVFKLSRSTIPSDIEIVQEVSPDCGMVMADPTQLHQIAMNLITNAYHAVAPAGGRISVSLKEAAVAGPVPPAGSLRPGRYAKLSVSDTGTGIDPAVMDKIFEPYFTTKPRGKGTGLGLAVVYGLVKGHGGDILVSSAPGKGTAVDVYLPLMKKHTEAEPAEKAEIAAAGSERILLVDDEEPIARLEKTMLERLGYRVVSRTGSVDALHAFKDDPSSFDLLITDMTMPNMTGDQLAKEVLAIRSDIPVIICTGFSERLDRENAGAIGIRGFLMKPIVRAELVRTVRRVLDEAK